MAFLLAAYHMFYNRYVLHTLQEGDLVEFPRGLCSHWGLYVGNSKIVHMCRDDVNDADGNAFFRIWSTLLRDVDRNASVKMENFWNVVNNSLARQNNSKDQECDPLPTDEIKARALSKIGEISYSVLWSNCEHFAAWCRYDRHALKQVNNLPVGGGGGGDAGAGGGEDAGAGATATVNVVTELRMRNPKLAANRAVLHGLIVGDLVEFPRRQYSDWGVYIGDNEIVHMCRDDDNDAYDSAFLSTWSTNFGASVKRENFWVVVKDSLARKNNSKDQECDPLPSDEIKARAFTKLGPIAYSVVQNNREPFAAWCRYGRYFSQ